MQMGVLLRSDLTGHGHPIHLGRKGLDGHVLLGQSSMQDFDYFSIMFYCIISKTYEKLDTYFALFIVLNFCLVCLMG